MKKPILPAQKTCRFYWAGNIRVVSNAKSNTINIISLQEHRHFHPNQDLKFTKVDKYQLVTTSACKYSQNATIVGIGMLLSHKASENLIQIEKIYERIMVAEFNSNPKLTFIACYSPTNCSTDEEITNFYQNWKSIIECVPSHNFLTIAGDFNAKIVPENALFTFDNKTNRNGELLLDLLDEFNLLSSTNHFQKKKSKLWTFTYPNGTRAQLDYIIFRKKWGDSAQDAEAYSSVHNKSPLPDFRFWDFFWLPIY